ncbi:M81 family metallopeptidase [Treponema phagedenis]|uniref:M81 family metallopeptidase n=1 Tax=Treponema phagedenis TaxID=162 RepID=UPI00197FD343|nr:M81 family metallopeptidase [Treponema phagedenis]QSH94646.1 MlrC domain-containing protein [Treponema phagedenis]
MRILVGGISHESNSFNPIITGINDFVVFRGEEVLTKGLLPYYSSTGIIDTLRGWGWEVVPALVARAVPNGLVQHELYQSLKAEFLHYLDEALTEAPIDGICLGLHGSLKVENLGAAEGDLLAAIRERLPDVPLTVALDMHATVTDEMIRYCDGIVGYKTAPHIDCYETGVHAAKLLRSAFDSGKKLCIGRVSIPMLIAGEKSESAEEPMKSLLAACVEAEKRDGILAASILLGFPWADCEDNGVSIVTVSDGCQKLADETAKELACKFWIERHNFRFRAEHYDSVSSILKAIEAVTINKEQPVFISDSGDNPTAGATGDATELFEAMLSFSDKIQSLPTPLLYSGFFDAPAVDACMRAGEGKTLDITIGGNLDKINGKQIPCTVKVLRLVKDYGTYRSNLALVEYKNMHIVLTGKHIGFGDENLLPALGVNPLDYCIVTVKLGYLEACFQDIAARAIMATSKGCSNELLETLDYPKTRKPIYPLNKNMEWSC